MVCVFQGPHVLKNPKKILHQSSIQFNIGLRHPWTILVRICASSIAPPLKVKNVRFRSIDKDQLLILWNDYEYANYERCVRSYEIYYTPTVSSTNSRNPEWIMITDNKHIPFLSYIHQVTKPIERLQGNKWLYELHYNFLH